MTDTTGRQSRARSFGVIEPVGELTLGRLLFLLGLGAAIIALKETFRFPLGLPGHHGLEAMALLAVGRLSCTHRWSATLVAASAATTAIAIGAGHSPLAPMFYLLPGIVMDLAVRGAPAWRQSLWLLPIAAALAHATKPLSRWLIAEPLDLQFGSLLQGLAWPLALHLAFGFTGALIAVLAWRKVAETRRT